jgi:hypothetical protein
MNSFFIGFQKGGMTYSAIDFTWLGLVGFGSHALVAGNTTKLGVDRIIQGIQARLVMTYLAFFFCLGKNTKKRVKGKCEN